jgi:hypothetical protein
MNKLNILKIASFVLTVAGFFIVNEVQKREINEAVEKQLAQRLND